jgi:hypothetical protein
MAPPTLSMGQSRYKMDYNKKSSSLKKDPKLKFEPKVMPASVIDVGTMYKNEFPEKHSAR